MQQKFGNLPLPVCAVICVGLSLVWWRFWPREKAPAQGVIRWILRWGHSLTWVCLFLAAIVAMQSGTWVAATSRGFALAALGMYLTFVAALMWRLKA